MRISDWSSDVCSSVLVRLIQNDNRRFRLHDGSKCRHSSRGQHCAGEKFKNSFFVDGREPHIYTSKSERRRVMQVRRNWKSLTRSEEHTSELQSLMRISYAVFCLKKKT